MAYKSSGVGKLIRDGLPDMMQAKGIVVHTRVMNQDEFLQKLKDKLSEEAQEVLRSQTPEELVEELADVLEVIRTLSSALNISMQQIDEKRVEKRKLKGGFEGRIFNEHVDIDEKHEEVSHYLNTSRQHPEMDKGISRSECLFCRRATEPKEAIHIAEFQHCYIVKDRFPVSPGHLLIIPYVHTENWFTAGEEVRLDIVKALHFAKERLDRDYKPHGYNIGVNCGEAAGQSIMHLHVHLIPRYQGDMDDPKGGVRGVIPSEQKY